MNALRRGYVTDIPYTRGFIRELAPAWLDFAATVSGVAPPDCRDGFAWCELGCGQGVTTTVLAATHPQGRFVGVDLMPQHVEHARRFAAEAGVRNVRFIAADFAEANLDAAGFDYIVAHGVYSWIDAATQAAMRRLIDRHLRPGGLAYLSYNAMPGRAADLPFQRLVYALGEGLSGDSGARFLTAAGMVRGLRDAGAPSLAASPIAEALEAALSERPLAYLAHEYMNDHWHPLWVTEVRAAMAEIGLIPAGSATLMENFDSFVLRRAEREALAAIDDPDRRELARDYLMHQRFRRDVFSRQAAPLEDDARRERLLGMRYALSQPPGQVEFAAQTEAGRISFDNKVARMIAAALADGPRAGAAMVCSGTDRQELIANLMALCAGGAVRPVARTDAPVADLNRAIRRRLGGPEEIEFVALRVGTALHVAPAVLRALNADSAGVDAATAEWLRYLSIYAPD